MGKEVPGEAVNEMLAHYVLPVSKDMPRADECFDEVIFTELGRSEAQRYLEEMKSLLRSGSNLSSRSDFSPYSREISVQSFNSPSSVAVPGRSWQTSNLRSQKDNPRSPVQVKSLYCGPPELPSGTYLARTPESSMPHHRPFGSYSDSGSPTVPESYSRSADVEPYVIPRIESPIPSNSDPYMRYTPYGSYSRPVNHVPSSVDRPIYGDRTITGPSAYPGEIRHYDDHRLPIETSYGRHNYLVGRSLSEHFDDIRSPQFARGPLFGQPDQLPGTHGPHRNPPYGSSMPPEQWRREGYPPP